MGFFRGIKNNIKKSEAAVIIQNLLEMQSKTGLYDRDPASSANEIVGAFWDKSVNILDGRFGQRPHKISLAAAALGDAISKLGQHPYSNNYSICLGNILNEISVNGALYSLNSLDHKLLEESALVLRAHSDEFLSGPLGKEIGKLVERDLITWDQWYDRYKAAAAAANDGLSINERGMSLIDFMDDEPTRRAYADGVDPTELGRIFGEQFDITTFGSN